MSHRELDQSYVDAAPATPLVSPPTPASPISVTISHASASLPETRSQLSHDSVTAAPTTAISRAGNPERLTSRPPVTHPTPSYTTYNVQAHINATPRAQISPAIVPSTSTKHHNRHLSSLLPNSKATPLAPITVLPPPPNHNQRRKSSSLLSPHHANTSVSSTASITPHAPSGQYSQQHSHSFKHTYTATPRSLALSHGSYIPHYHHNGLRRNTECDQSNPNSRRVSMDSAYGSGSGSGSGGDQHAPNSLKSIDPTPAMSFTLPTSEMDFPMDRDYDRRRGTVGSDFGSESADLLGKSPHVHRNHMDSLYGK